MLHRGYIESNEESKKLETICVTPDTLSQNRGYKQADNFPDFTALAKDLCWCKFGGLKYALSKH